MCLLLLRHFHYVIDPPRFQVIPIIENHSLSHSLNVRLGLTLCVYLKCIINSLFVSFFRFSVLYMYSVYLLITFLSHPQSYILPVHQFFAPKYTVRLCVFVISGKW